jgi:hypothetical protein
MNIINAGCQRVFFLISRLSDFLVIRCLYRGSKKHLLPSVMLPSTSSGNGRPRWLRLASPR